MKFFHLRVRRDARDGKPVYHRASDKAAKFEPKGGMTIGYVPANGDGTKLLMTFSRCSERDVWNRQRAIQICLGRFAKGKDIVEVDRSKDQDKYEVLLNAALTQEKKVEEKRQKLGIKARI